MAFDRLILARTWVRDDVTLLQILVGEYEHRDPRSPRFQVAVSLHPARSEPAPRSQDVSTITGAGWSAITEHTGEPSMEDVLASIRKIISEEDRPSERSI